MILAAARDLNLDLNTSLLIGDQPSDIRAADAAGITADQTLMVAGAGPSEAAAFVRAAWNITAR